MRLLLVDDERRLLNVLEHALGEHYDVCTAESVESAVRAVEASAPFAIVCDLNLPDGDGTGLYDIVSARWPELAQRMVFMTGGIGWAVRAKALASGCPILEKPFSVIDMVEIVQSVTRLGASGRAARAMAGSGHR